MKTRAGWMVGVLIVALAMGIFCMTKLGSAGEKEAKADRGKPAADATDFAEFKIGVALPELQIHALSTDGREITVPVPNFQTEFNTMFPVGEAHAKEANPVTVTRHYQAEGFTFDLSLTVTSPDGYASSQAGVAKEILIAEHFVKAPKREPPTTMLPIRVGQLATLKITNLSSQGCEHHPDKRRHQHPHWPD